MQINLQRYNSAPGTTLIDCSLNQQINIFNINPKLQSREHILHQHYKLHIKCDPYKTSLLAATCECIQ
jgi:hypothetical protein